MLLIITKERLVAFGIQVIMTSYSLLIHLTILRHKYWKYKITYYEHLQDYLLGFLYVYFLNAYQNIYSHFKISFKYYGIVSDRITYA